MYINMQPSGLQAAHFDLQESNEADLRGEAFSAFVEQSATGTMEVVLVIHPSPRTGENGL